MKSDMSAREILRDFNNISKYIGHTELTHELIVFKALNYKHGFKKNTVNGDVVETYSDVVLMSTTPLIKAAVRFAQKWQLDTICMIYVSPGKGKCADINKYSEKIDREYEMLMRRNGKYKVMRKDTLVADGTEYRFIVMKEMK